MFFNVANWDEPRKGDEMTKYYKILNEDECHHGMQYKNGLNTDVLPFNPSGSCEPGGIYFSDVENILEFAGYGPWIREVTLPEGEEVYKDPVGNKYKAHSVILGKRRRWATKTIIKKLISEGANIHACDDYALRWAAQCGHTDTVELLLQNGANIHTYEDWALCCAARYGHTATVEMLLQNGANIHADDDYALRWAALCGYTATVEMLKKWTAK